MARKPGASGIIVAALILGLITAYLVWYYMRDLQKGADANRVDVVVAAANIPARKKITRDMIKLERLPVNLVAPDSAKRLEEVEGKMALDRVRPLEQIRLSDLAKDGQGPNLSFEIPPGKRAITIGVDEIKGVGSTIKPGDKVDILATYTDPVTRQETTQMILQNVLVLAVDKGNTDRASQQGANTSITLAVAPEDAELLAAADRAGVLRCALRPVEEDIIVASPGTRTSDILRGRMEFAQPTNSENRSTSVIISPQPARSRPELKIVRGTKEQVVPAE
jgi:pilus assembly protein CpaB